MTRKSNVVGINDVWWPVDNREAKAYMETDLARSGLKPSDVPDIQTVEHKYAKGISAYIIPYRGTDHYRVRVARKDNKYLGPKGGEPRLYFPKGITPESFRSADVKYVCEGEKKAIVIAKRFGVQAVGIGGCWQWGKGNRLLPELQDGIKSNDTITYIADRDVLDGKKLNVARAAKAFMMAIKQFNCAFSCIVPPLPHKGADDWVSKAKGVLRLDTLDELDLESYHWFPVKMLQANGIQFEPNANGEVISHKQMYSNMHNSVTLMGLLYDDTTAIEADKYTGYSVNGMAADLDAIYEYVKTSVSFLFPKLKFDVDAVSHYMWLTKYVVKLDNCMQRYVKSLEWDKVKRLETWMSKAMVLAPNMETEYVDNIGMTMMCAMYDRIMNPGCQQDYMFILSGPGGVGKSTFFSTLGRFPHYDGHIMADMEQIGAGTPTEGSKMKQAVVLDLDDLETMSRKSKGALKSFISRKDDEWRGLYKRATAKEPRGFIMVGSTNNKSILTDIHNLRRFLIVEIANLKSVVGAHRWKPELRDQLLAECHARWAEYDGQWWRRLDTDKVTEVNSEFMVNDPVVDAIIDMHKADRVATHHIHGPVISQQALAAWMNDPKYSAVYLGIRLTGFRDAIALPFTFGKKVQVRVEFLDTMSIAIKNKYLPANQVDRMWVYPVTFK